MKANARLWAFLIVTFLLAALGFYVALTNSSLHSLSSTPVYDRVIRSRELRVGYLIEPPYLMKDTASGKLSGVFYDFTEEMGRRLGLKVVWVEEANLANLAAGFEGSRYDMLAFPLWRNSSRGVSFGFSAPLYYTPVGIYVRADDARFDRNLRSIDDSSVNIAGIDGELAFDIARSDFPRASRISLPQYSDYSQMLLDIAARKADVTFFDRVLADRFIARNPGKIKEISGGRPIRLYADCFLLPASDFRFQGMINASIEDLVENRVLDGLFSKYGETPEQYYRVAIPYRSPGP